jgi:hypothetical protein
MTAPAVDSTTESLAGDPADNETQCTILRPTNYAPGLEELLLRLSLEQARAMAETLGRL